MTNTRGISYSWQPRRFVRHWLVVLVALALAGAGVVVVAQYQVNRQISGVNTQIYGNTSSSVRYGRSYQPTYGPQQNLLPSENRNLIYRSGALPSTIRMNHAAVGPMAPQGVAAYVPEPQNFRSSGVAQGNYVNTISSARMNPMSAMPPMSAPAMPGTSAGSIRYASPAAGAKPVGGFAFGSASPSMSSQMKAPTPTANATPQSGSIKYSWKLSP